MHHVANTGDFSMECVVSRFKLESAHVAFISKSVHSLISTSERNLRTELRCTTNRGEMIKPRDRIYFILFRLLQPVPIDLVKHLQVHPVLGRGPKKPGQPPRGIGSHRALSLEKLRNTVCRNLQIRRQLIRAHTKLLQLVSQQFAGMNRSTHINHHYFRR